MAVSLELGAALGDPFMPQTNDRSRLEKLIGVCGGAVLLIAIGAGVGYKLRASIEDLKRDVLILVGELRNDPLTVSFKGEDSGPLDVPAGFQKFREVEDSGYLLLSAYLPDERRTPIQLIDLATGETLKRWDPDPEAIRARSDYPAFAAINRYSPKSPMLLEDGGVAFIDDRGPLVRLDACGEIQWVADGEFHHSLERDLDGNFILPILLPEPTRTNATPYPFKDDAIAIVSPAGKLLETRSVAKMLIDNGYLALFYAAYPSNLDPIHLNDVEVARTDTANWRRGDWVVSIRPLSTVFIYRPSTGKIVWLKNGPWLRQHDPDFADDGTISIFSNDAMGGGNRYVWGYSRTLVVNPATNAVTSLYENRMKEGRIRTKTQGLHRILANGDVFIEQTDLGRLVRIGPEGLVWSYYNKADAGVGVLHWSRFLTAQEFGAVDLSKRCE